MSLPPLPGMGATTKEENYDKITAWANAVGALALGSLQKADFDTRLATRIKTETTTEYGRTTSIYDAANNRWQVIDCDTGSRDVSTILKPGWTATAFQITRFAGYLVELRIIGLSGSGASTGVVATLPPGFQVGSTGAGPRGIVVNAAGVVTGRLQVGSDINANSLTVNGDVTMMWRTNQARPIVTDFPLIGSIPNS